MTTIDKPAAQATARPAPALAPGLHAGVSDAIYFADSAISRSDLKSIASYSVAHWLAWLDTPRQPSPSMILGSAAHCALLEPEAYGDRYTVAPECDRRTKDGKAAWAEHAAAAGERAVLRAQDDAVAHALAAAVRAHPTAGPMFARPGLMTEVVAVWIDAPTGLRLRAKIDAIVPGIGGSPPLIVDLKTTADARPHAFSGSCASYGYDMQAAFYADGFEAICGERPDWVYVVVETSHPYAVAVYRPDDAMIAAGRAKYRRALDALRRAGEPGAWSGYPAVIQTLELPRYAQETGTTSVLRAQADQMIERWAHGGVDE